MKSAVKIREILEKTVIVDTDTGSFDDAVQMVSDAYRNGEVILDADDISEVEFEESLTFGKEPIADDDERLKLFTKL